MRQIHCLQNSFKNKFESKVFSAKLDSKISSQYMTFNVYNFCQKLRTKEQCSMHHFSPPINFVSLIFLDQISQGGAHGHHELLHIPCRQEVLAPTKQRELFLILSASTQTFSTVPGQERTHWLWDSVEEERCCRNGRRWMLPVDRRRGTSNHKSEKDVGPEERASNPVRKPPWCMDDRWA